MAADVSDSSKTVFEGMASYFSTVQGWLSVVPTILALFDSVKGWLPIAMVIKPWVYLLIVLLTVFSIWFEVSRFLEAREPPKCKPAMRRRAVFHIVLAVALIGFYWTAGELINAFTPEQILYRTLELFGLAVLVGLIFAETTRAFAILALTTASKRLA